MQHYGMTPSTNNPGQAHENGDVEQAHFRFKGAVDQALRVRGSRDFVDRAAYAKLRHYHLTLRLLAAYVLYLPILMRCRLARISGQVAVFARWPEVFLL
jgi:hypothetical protein